jgi:UDP-N-acetylmuramoyl-L-alanine---L-glutamate ligase
MVLMTSPMTSRPRICWSDLTGASVGVWGLGVEGAANLRRLSALGVTPVLVDDHPDNAQIDGLSVLATGAGGWEALCECEIVIKTPGISRYRPDVEALVDQGVTVVGGLGLWLEETDRTKVVCITGTKGKSTTTALVGHLLNNLGRPCLVAGNIGRVPYDPAVASDYELVALEVSSFQATDLSCATPVVAVTSLHPDHLDWHGSVEAYYADKLSICTLPEADLTVANGESPELRAHVGALGPRVDWVQPTSPPPSWIQPLGLVGIHNQLNAVIAARCIQALGVETDEGALEEAARGFQPLPSRLEEIGSVAGVTFVDDSLSTNALASMAALDALGGRAVALIAGGADRGIDYRPLAERIVRRAEPTLVVTLPASGVRIHGALRDAAVELDAPLPEIHDTGDLASAVEKAFAWSEPGAVVLLSPAAASFGQFANYQERSRAFHQAMEACARS